MLEKEQEHLEATVDKLQALSLKAGATSVEVCGVFSQTMKIQLEKQDFHMAAADHGYSLGIRVLHGNRQGFSSCNSTEPAELQEASNRAVEISRMSPENPFQNIQKASPNKKSPKTFDESLAQLPVSQLKDWTQALIECATKDSRIRVNDGGLDTHTGLVIVANSEGTRAIEPYAVLSWGLMGMASEGENLSSFDSLYEISRTCDSVEQRIRNTTERFSQQLIGNLKTGKGKSYNGLVAFSPRAVIDVLLAGLGSHLNGRSIIEGTSQWKMEDLGKRTLHQSIHLEDNPWLPDRTGYTSFDREGTPTQCLKLVEAGTLKNFLFDHYAATAAQCQSTGHASGGPSSLPSVSPHCFVMGAGTTPLPSLMKEASQTQSEMLYVNRFSGQVDPVTGDFSGVAKGGDWWVQGQHAFCVKETLISGNVFEAMGDALFGLSKEREIVHSGSECPVAIADKVSVTSK